MEGEVSVRVPPAQLFRLWRDVENLPTLVSHIESVERRGTRRSHWKMRGGEESPLEWDVEADDEVENERLGWRSVRGAPVDSVAAITFVPVMTARRLACTWSSRMRRPRRARSPRSAAASRGWATTSPA
jgi:uncharacterized membrane protein